MKVMYCSHIHFDENVLDKSCSILFSNSQIVDKLTTNVFVCTRMNRNLSPR